MGEKCHTKDGEIWVSTVGGRPDGAFTITSEDGAGNFEGIHSGVRIKGTCTGTHITYNRPATSPVHVYSGRFNGSGDRIRGTRTSARRAVKAPADDEDWEGTKTTTLLNAKTRKKR